MRILYGLTHADAGTIAVDGRPVTIRAPRDAIAAGLGQTFGVDSQFILHEGVPPLENDAEVADFLYEVSKDVLGEENVSYRPPAMGSSARRSLARS